jgi:ribosomal protein S18 acetylase RimI-like enzyme
MAWAEERVRSGLAARNLGAVLPMKHVLSAWAGPDIPGVAALASRTGFVVESYGMMMTRPLSEPIPDLPLPEGLRVRPVLPEDHRKIWDADSEAFQDHRDPAVRTEADFVGAFADPSTDTSLWQVAWDGDEVAGSVMNTIYPDENERLGVRRGWLDAISVRRPWRKRGLASALIARSLQLLKERGIDEAALGADTENLSGAVRLYEGLGFRRIHLHANYRKPIEIPGQAGH